MIPQLKIFFKRNKYIIALLNNIIYYNLNIFIYYSYIFLYTKYFTYESSKLISIHVPFIIFFYLYIIIFYTITFFEKKIDIKKKVSLSVFTQIFIFGIIGILSGVIWSKYIWSVDLVIDNKIYIIIIILLIIIINKFIIYFIRPKEIYIFFINNFFVIFLISLLIISQNWNNLHHTNIFIIQYHYYYISFKSILILINFTIFSIFNLLLFYKYNSYD